jgi:long-chain acyl-CoA synthetase
VKVTVSDAFVATVDRWKARLALAYFSEHWSYEELHQDALAFAGALRSRGTKPGDRVAIATQNDPAFVVAALGTWAVGGVVVPINPMLREREMEHIFTDSGARVVICLSSIAQRVVTAGGGRLKTVVSAGSRYALEPMATPDRSLTSAHDLEELILGYRSTPATLDVCIPPESPALLMYTSGTTGAPKGAVLSHQNVLASVNLWRTYADLTSTDVVLGLAPLCHITGTVAQLCCALLNGAALVLMHRFDPHEAWRAVERHRVTFGVAAITAFVAMRGSPERGRRDVSSVRLFVTGGAPAPAAIVDSFARDTGIALRNAYGLTETTSLCTGVPVGTRAPLHASGALSVGRAVGATALRVVEVPSGRDVNPGVAGELLVRGPQVCAGYWKNPIATSELLCGDWLRTGDVAVIDAAGWVYIIDRIKDMIVASGYKVWPREIEDVLVEHSAVSEACVIGVPDDYRGENVRAYVTLRSSSAVALEELDEFARTRLAAYKRPREIRIVDSLPKTLSGKILKREVRARAAAEDSPHESGSNEPETND